MDPAAPTFNFSGGGGLGLREAGGGVAGDPGGRGGRHRHEAEVFPPRARVARMGRIYMVGKVAL